MRHRKGIIILKDIDLSKEVERSIASAKAHDAGLRVTDSCSEFYAEAMVDQAEEREREYDQLAEDHTRNNI